MKGKSDGNGAISGKTATFAVGAFVILVLAVSGTVAYFEFMNRSDEPDLVIYAYESFQSYGLGPAVIPEFEKLHGVKVKIVTPGDVGTTLGRVNMERGDPKADIVIGVDNSMIYRAVEMDILEPYIPTNIDRLNPSMLFDPDHYVVPFDYGYIAIICNGEMMAEKGLKIPDNILDLADDIYDGELLLLDPAASSTGSSFMIWAASVAGDDHGSFFQDLADNANGRVLGSWDAMYDAWGRGEAPIAISYGLDTAYEMMWYGTNNTITVVPEDQGYRQIEGAGLVKGAPHEDLAKKFLDFILTDTFQEQVYNNYMLPVVLEVGIDPMFQDHGVFAKTHVEPTTEEVVENYDIWYEAWRNAFL